MAAAQTIVLKCGPKGVPFKIEYSSMTEHFEHILYKSLVKAVELSTPQGATPQPLGSVNVVVQPDEVAADDTFAQSYEVTLSDIWQQLLLRYRRPASGEADAPTEASWLFPDGCHSVSVRKAAPMKGGTKGVGSRTKATPIRAVRSQRAQTSTLLLGPCAPNSKSQRA
jgi:hypothetical protein